MAYSKGDVALVLATICVVPVIAFALVWTGILATLFVMWLWYSGSIIPVSFLAAGLAYYLMGRHDAKMRPAHAM